MAVDQRNLPAFFNTDGDFQTWVQGLEAQFSACGLTQTSDTGQINSATVTKPGAINTAQGYHVYKFNDSQQGTRPVFLKIEFGSRGATDRPGLWVTTGTGSDGAGTLTGLGTRRQIGASASKSAGNTLPSYCSGDGSRLALVLNYDSSSTTFGFGCIVDRSRDANGATTSEAWTCNCFDNVTTVPCEFVYSGGTATTTSVTWPSVNSAAGLPCGNGVTILGNNVALMPMMMMVGLLRYGLAAAFYKSGDISGGTAITVLNLGSNHTYMPLPSVVGPKTTGSDPLAIIWE